MKNVNHIKQAESFKDLMWLIINTFREEKGMMFTKPTVCKKVGTYNTRFSQAKTPGRLAWEKLEYLGILKHPRASYNNRPLKNRYVLSLPDEEIELIMSKLREDGRNFKGSYKRSEPVFSHIDLSKKEEEVKEDIEESLSHDNIEEINEKARVITLQIKDVKITIEL